MAKKNLYAIVDSESGALEYGPAEGAEAAKAHFEKFEALDLRGELADTVGRKLVLYKLVEA